MAIRSCAAPRRRQSLAALGSSYGLNEEGAAQWLNEEPIPHYHFCITTLEFRVPKALPSELELRTAACGWCGSGWAFLAA